MEIKPLCEVLYFDQIELLVFIQNNLTMNNNYHKIVLKVDVTLKQTCGYNTGLRSRDKLSINGN